MKSKWTGIVAIVGLALMTQAGTIVKWGQAGGDANIITSGNAAQNDLTTTYSDTVQINPGDGANGYDINAAGQTRIFYGASSRDQGPNVVNNDNAGTTGDHMQMVQRVSGLTSYNAMIAWKASDFLTADRELETLAIEFSDRDNGTDTRANAYFVLETSDGWYRSNQSASETTGNYTSWTANVGDLTWSALSDYGLTGGAVAADTTDIQSIGYYMAAENDAGVQQWFGAKTRYFEVTAIPEAASLGMIASVGVGVLFIRRRIMM